MGQNVYQEIADLGSVSATVRSKLGTYASLSPSYSLFTLMTNPMCKRSSPALRGGGPSTSGQWSCPGQDTFPRPKVQSGADRKEAAAHTLALRSQRGHRSPRKSRKFQR